MFNRSRPTRVVASGPGSVASAGRVIGNISTGGSRRGVSHTIANNVEVISDGSITEPLCFETINGEVFLNGRKIEWSAR